MQRLPTLSGLMRRRDGHESSRVSFLELFFDLVFVFAITQLSHTLLEHFTLRGLLEIGLLLMATWWVWMYTTWSTNWLDPATMPVRLMLVLVMFGSLLISTSIPEAFGDFGLTFAIAYVVVQIGRTVFMGMAFGERSRAYQSNPNRIVVWFLASAPFWLGGGVADGDARLVLWALALIIDYTAPSVGYWVPGMGRALTTDWDISAAHMAERCGLFIIIALGESVLVAGATYSDLERTPPVIAAFVAAFVSSVVLWWIYFGTIAEDASRHFEEQASPGRTAITAYTYLHLPIVAGIIIVAVGDEFVLAHPEGRSDVQTVLAVVGGPMVFLVGTLLFKVVSGIGRFPVSHLVGLGIMGLLLPFASDLSPLTLSCLTTVILIVVGAWESLADRAGSLATRRATVQP